MDITARNFISTQLEKHTCEYSLFETSRDYISMSHAGLAIEEIIEQQRNGFKDTPEIRLRCYKGYQMEADLRTRIQKTFGDKIKFGIEYSAFDGHVKGHPDFTIDGLPGDCKTVPLDEHLPTNHVPRKVYWQMQSYMLYGNKSRALVIYESRETGRIKDFWIMANPSIQSEIDIKYRIVINRLKSIV